MQPFTPDPGTPTDHRSTGGRRRRWLGLLLLGSALAVGALVTAIVAVSGGPEGTRTAAASGPSDRAGSTSVPTTTAPSGSSSTSIAADAGAPGGGQPTGGGSGGAGAPAEVGPRLRAPQAPVVLPVGVDTGSFSIANVGDAPLHLLGLDHPGVVWTGHEDPVPDVIAPGSTVEIRFGQLAPNLNDFTPGPWQRVIGIRSDGGDAEVLVRGTAPVPGDLSAPEVVPPVPHPQGQGFWIEQVGGAPTSVEITVDPGLTLNDVGSFTMGVGAKGFVGVSPCGRPAAAVDKTMMRKVYLHVGGHGTYEVQVFWEIEAGPAVACT